MWTLPFFICMFVMLSLLKIENILYFEQRYYPLNCNNNNNNMSSNCFINTDVVPLQGELLSQFLCDLDWTDHAGVRLHFYYEGKTERDDQADPTIGWWNQQDHIDRTWDFARHIPVGKVTDTVHTKIYGDRSDVIQILYPFVNGDNCYLYHVNSAGVRPVVFASAVCEGNASRQPHIPVEIEIEIKRDDHEEKQEIQVAKLNIIADLSWIDSAGPAQLRAYIREQAVQHGERLRAEYDGIYMGKLEVEWADRLLAVRNAT